MTTPPLSARPPASSKGHRVGAIHTNAARAPVARTVATVVTAGMALGGLAAIWVARREILVLFAGVLLAILLATVTDAVASRLRIRRGWALAGVLLTVAGTLTLGLTLRGPAVVEQLGALQDALPRSVAELGEELAKTAWGRWVVASAPRADTWLPSFADMLTQARGAITTSLSLIVALVIAIAIGIFVAAEPARYRDGVLRLVPMRHQARVTDILAAVGHNLRWWLVARAVSMLAVGVMVTAGLLVLRVPLAGTLGVLAALLTFVPNVGPIVSAILPILLVLPTAPPRALAVGLLFLGVHGIEGFVVSPLVERRAVQLPPALTLAVQVLMATLVGGIGIAMAAPVTVVGVVLAHHFGTAPPERSAD